MKNVDKFQKLIWEIEEEFNIVNKVDFVFATNKYDKESITYLDDTICKIEVGIKDYANIEKITDKQYNHICNTILHEMIHVRNYYLLSEKLRDRLSNNKRTLAHFARKLLDEYVAYNEANQRFPEVTDELNGSIEEIFNAFNHMTRGILIKATEFEFYCAFCDYCTSLIVRYLLDKESFNIYCDNISKEAFESFMSNLKRANMKMPLTYEQYESLGWHLMKDLLLLIPKEKHKVFKINTHVLNV